MNTNETTPAQIAIRIVIVIVVIIALLFLSFALVRFVPKALNSLSGLRDMFVAKERIIIDLEDATIEQNGQTTLTFRQSGGKEEGFYELSYPCARIASETRLEVSSDDFVDIIKCDEPYFINNASTSSEEQTLTLRATNSSVSYDQPIVVTITHMNGQTELASETVTITVKGGVPVDSEIVATSTVIDTVTTTKTPTEKQTKIHTTYIAPKTTYNNTATYYNTSPANLRAHFTGARNNGNQQTTLMFNVTNHGGQPSGPWSFYATVPRDRGTTVFNSGYQPSIPPGKTSIMYLTFDNAVSGNVHVTINGKTFTTYFTR